MRILLPLFFSVFLSLNAFGQLPPELWHQGYAFINERDTVYGQIKYNFVGNLIQVRQGEKVNTFSAQSITMFVIDDEISRRRREFFVVPYSMKGSYRSPVIFELLKQGEHMTLFAREVLVQDNMPFYSSYHMMGNTMRRERLEYDFYFMDKQGKIVKYERKKRELYRFIFKDKSNEVKRYMKKNKIKHDKAVGLIKLTAYYNELKSGKIKPE